MAGPDKVHVFLVANIFVPGHLLMMKINLDLQIAHLPMLKIFPVLTLNLFDRCRMFYINAVQIELISSLGQFK